MISIKKRSADNLLKAAKRLTKENPEGEKDNSLRIARIDNENRRLNVDLSTQCEVKIVENKRSHEVPGYINLPPAEFMAWYITSTGAKRKSSNILLKYLKHKYGENIPTDYRTLLRTPVKPVPANITPGNYVHLGVRQALMQSMAEAENILSEYLLLQFFIDGLLIFRSTKSDAWIIMLNVRNVSKYRLVPKVVGIHYDKKKPSDFNDFLWPFVSELLELLDTGFVYNSQVLKLNILNFVLDAPAKTSCKCVKHINGYSACDYCLADGDWIDHRMTFLDLDAPLRNDFDYRARIYDDYHKTESVLELLPIDMVLSFPPDYLHCVLLGVVHWILGYIHNTPQTLSANDHVKISKRIERFAKTQPVEFQRTLRTFVGNLGLMKGTEFRQYLLFIFPLLLKGIVSEAIIENFIKLQIASIIFGHQRFEQYYNEADELMRMFIQEFAEIYHPRHVVYVEHSLCHIKPFVEKYGPWDNFSTFEYESYNSRVKEMLHGNVMPLTQIANRIVEIYNAPQYRIGCEKTNIEVKDRQSDGSFSTLKYYDLTFKTNKEIGQNFVLLKSGVAVKLLMIEYDILSCKVKLTGKPFKHRSSVYSCVNTMRFNIFKSSYEFNKPFTFEVDEIDAKFWKLDINNSNVSAYFPLYVEDGKSFSRGHNPNI